MRIARLKNTTAKVRLALAGERISRTEDLWREIGTPFREGLEAVAGKTGLSEQEVASVLTAELLYEPAGWTLAVKDISFVAVVLALYMLARLTVADPPVSPEFVLANKTLSALQLVEIADLEMGPSESPALKATEDAVGRRVLLPIAKGEALTEAHLTPKGIEPAQLEGRVLLELPLEGEPGELAAAVGESVKLLFSPKVLAGQGGLEAEALVLRLDSSSGENVATVAVGAESVSAITRFLATSEVSIARRCCPQRDPPAD